MASIRTKVIIKRSIILKGALGKRRVAESEFDAALAAENLPEDSP